MIDTQGYLSRSGCSISKPDQEIKEIKMAKRSYIKSIESKQTSAYKGVTRTAPAIQQLDGSSKREASRIRIKMIRSWTIRNNFVNEAIKDAQAEKIMNPHNWSNRRNPICPVCHIQKSLSGECGC